jgi:hypothetical protein
MHVTIKYIIIISTVLHVSALMRHLQGELYRVLKTITLFDYRSKAILYMGLQFYIQLFKKTICGST